jgi:hypothetical protein
MELTNPLHRHFDSILPDTSSVGWGKISRLIRDIPRQDAQFAFHAGHKRLSEWRTFNVAASSIEQWSSRLAYAVLGAP